ncbi:MAG: transporter [Bacteroidetes bacterium HGW-Bacteroidetes-8]|nr:MAG: transporter [Bacteroidetes bacterium HGW-Bacteroidetes-8]
MQVVLFTAILTVLSLMPSGEQNLPAMQNPALGQEQAVRKHTLEECVELATQNYPLIKRYDLIEKAKEYTIRNIAKSHLPQVALSAKGSYQSDVTSIPIVFPGMAIDPMSKDQYSAIVNVEQTIWDGGISGAYKKQSEATAASQRMEVEVELYTLRERVHNIYFGILLAEGYIQELRIAERELNRAKERVESYIYAGAANRSDLSAVEVELISLKQRMRELISDKEAFFTMLSQITGVEFNQNSTLQVPLVKSAENKEIMRPELNLFISRQNSLERERAVIDSRSLPKLGAYLQAGYGRPGLNMLKDEFAGFYTAGIKVVWNLGSLYTKRDELRLISLRQSEIDTQRELFLYNIRLKSTGVNSKIKKLQELLEDDRKMIELRVSLKDAAEKKLEGGTISVSEYLRELNILDIARSALRRREIELIMAHTELKYTLNN